MKVNKIFHWLYFLMLLLPIFAIPMYAIYVRNENSTFAQEITVQENKVVDFNQLVKNGNFATSDNWYLTNCTFDYSINGFYCHDTYAMATQSCNLVTGHTYYMRCKLETNLSVITLFYASAWSNVPVNTDNYYTTYSVAQGTLLDFAVGSQSASEGSYLRFISLNLFDLTQMFGSGNEPTAQQFDTWYTDDFYEYTLSDKQLLKNVNTVTYNDTDIGSQFTYTIYHSIDKYFNYDKVFNFGDLYDWLQLNFFNGNAPLGFFIFWHYLIYFLLTSLLWLLFDVLMYVPNLIHKWLDKAS